ncbi:hypothetical protein ACFL49_00855 [Candidatus Omnitrophota bacterium]
MKDNNVRALTQLSRFCKYSGMIIIFLGLFVIFVDVINNNWVHMQTGFFVFMCGYTFHKAGKKLSSILFDERTEVDWSALDKNEK